MVMGTVVARYDGEVEVWICAEPAGLAQVVLDLVHQDHGVGFLAQGAWQWMWGGRIDARDELLWRLALQEEADVQIRLPDGRAGTIMVTSSSTGAVHGCGPCPFENELVPH